MGAFQSQNRAIRPPLRTFAPVLLALVLFAAPSLFGQRVAEAYKLNLAKPSQQGPSGSWGVERHDRDAKALLEDRLVHVGIVEVLGAATHSKAENANKLRESGVMDFDGELALGARWDYHHAIREALREVTILIPEDSTRPAKWRGEDQALYELGRDAVPYIEARQRIEHEIETVAWQAFARAVMIRVLNDVTEGEELPSVLEDDGKRTTLERLEPLLRHHGASAILMLGPLVREELKAMSENLKEPKRQRWAGLLLEGINLVNEALGTAFSGVENAQGETTLRALQIGLPQDLERPDTWPQADQIFLRVGGLGAIRLLEAVRATNRAFAVKANWLIGQIRRRYANKLLDDLLILAQQPEPNQLTADYFKEGVVKIKDGEGKEIADAFNGIGPIDHMVALLICASDVKEGLGRQRDHVKTLRQSGVADSIVEANRIDLVYKVVNDALVAYADRFNARKIARLMAEFRQEPQRYAELMAEMKTEAASLKLASLGELERLRKEASRWEGKLNWFQDLIIERDRDAGRRRFVTATKDHAASFGIDLTRSELDELGQFGRIRVSPEWATRHGEDYDNLMSKGFFSVAGGVAYYLGDTRYERLRSLSRADFQTLLQKGVLELAVGISFYGEEDNDGRRYDYQNDVALKGLSINLKDNDDKRRTFDLMPGRTYVFSFEYFTKGLDGTKTWVEFVPLDADGRAIGPDGRPLTEAFLRPSVDPKGDSEPGKFTAFPFASESSKGKMTSADFGGDTGGTWVKAGFRLVSVPDPVHGFTIEMKINSLTGRGLVGYRNFKLEMVENYFSDGFEEPDFGSAATGKPRGTSSKPLENGTWGRFVDDSEGYAPWSDVSYNSDVRYSGERSLQIDPKGFNVRIESEEYFELNSERSYIFRGMLNTRRMEDMSAWFEVLLYDIDRNPVTIDGIATTHGNNAYSSPKRGNVSRQLLWESLSAPDGWYREEIVLDDLRPIDVEASSELKAIDPRRRHAIRFARIAIVVAGKHPSYSAQVLVDDIELRENPRVGVNLYQQEKIVSRSLPGSYEEEEVSRPVLLGRNFAEPKPIASGRPYRLLIGLEVTGLVPNRVGYHYTLDLYDYLGKKVKAADTIGAKALDKLVNSNSYGSIGVNEFGFIDLDSLDLANRFGYFSAHFRLSYKDEPTPIIERVFKIGFMPEPLNKKRTTPGDLGVIMDLNSSKTRWLDKSIRHLDAGRLGIPLMAPEIAADGSDYANYQRLEDLSYLMRLLPNVRRTAILGPLPADFEDIHAEGNADGVFSDGSRQEWKDLLKKIQGRWQDRFDDYIIGEPADDSFNHFTSHASQALDNLETEFAANRVKWAARIMPITLKSGAAERVANESFIKSFERRWTNALGAQAQTTQSAISAALTPDDERKIRETFPSQIWLKEGERFSFFVPADLPVGDFESSVNDYLSRVANYEDVLGANQATAVANARTLAAGGVVDFSALRDERGNHDLHTVVIDIKRVPTERYADQLSDLIEKIARARAIGFKRIFVSRLRNTGSDEAPDGLMTRGNLAQPAFYAFRTLNAVLTGRVVEPVTLNMRAKNDYLFFRDPDDQSLTFMLFATDQDAVEDLPFGNEVEQIDIMGNTTPLPSLAGSDGEPSGMVRVRVPANGLPVILKGIDNTLLDVVESLRFDIPTLAATESDQRRELSLTNSFDSRVTVNVSIPLGSSDDDDRNIAWDSRLKTLSGIEVGGARATTFDFDSRDVASGETVTFPFILKPRRSMGTGERFLPVRVVVKGKKVYEFTQRIKIDVISQLSITETTALDPGGNRGLDLIFKVQTSVAQTQALSATITLPDHQNVRARVRDFGLQANGNSEVSVTLPVIPKAKQEGLRVALNIRQKGGTDFLNALYRITVDQDTGGLKLVLADDYVLP